MDGSFLDRMTRPTAASSGHRHEKVAPKSPPKSKPAAKPKANGHLSKPAPEPAAPSEPVEESHEEAHDTDVPEANAPSGLSFAGNATTFEDAMAAVDDQDTGNETPNHHSTDEADAALEATPAGLGGEETIR